MFLLTAIFDIKDGWQQTDDDLRAIVGRPSDYGGATMHVRDCTWRVADFDEARRLKEIMVQMLGVSAMVREE